MTNFSKFWNSLSRFKNQKFSKNSIIELYPNNSYSRSFSLGRHRLTELWPAALSDSPLDQVKSVYPNGNPKLSPSQNTISMHSSCCTSCDDLSLHTSQNYDSSANSALSLNKVSHLHPLSPKLYVPNNTNMSLLGHHTSTVHSNVCGIPLITHSYLTYIQCHQSNTFPMALPLTTTFTKIILSQ